MATASGGIGVTEPVGESRADAVVGLEQRQHGVEPLEFDPRALDELLMQFGSQPSGVHGREFVVDLGHLLAFQAHQPLFRQVVECLEHPRAGGVEAALLAQLVEAFEVQPIPGTGLVRGIEQCAEKGAALAGKAGQQGFGFDRQAEAILCEVAVAGAHHAGQFQLDQQRLQRQLADVREA